MAKALWSVSTALTGVGVTAGITLVNSGSICSVESSSLTDGRYGGVISFRYSFSQSMSLNHGWFLISSEEL